MSELQLVIQDEQLLKEVTFNYEQLKGGLSERLKKYNELVVTEDAIKEAKTDRANLNKLEKALADKGSEIKQKLLGGFDTKLSELRSMVKSASLGIDKQVKSFEQKVKDDKKRLIEAIYNSNIGELEQLVSFEKIFNEKMLNVTSTMSKIEDEIKAKIEQIRKDLSVIDMLKVEPEIITAVKDYYLRTFDLSSALSEKTRLETVKANLIAIQSKPKVQEVVEPVKEQPKMVEVNPETLTPLLEQVDFRVWVTSEQKLKLREFLVNQNIKYGTVQ